MKKTTAAVVTLAIVLSSIFSVALATTYTKFSKDFMKNFKDCDKYEETINSEYEGKSFTTSRKIIGWRNGFCKYEEVVKSADGAYKLNCSLSSIQVEELYLAMKNRSKEPEKFDLELFTEQKDLKTGKVKYVNTGVRTIKGNKAYITWAKYQNNPYFCTPQKLSK